ncbi:MAG: RNA-directed DNA polymerase [Muribaculaceae bacterium]|nr:RNA-directed DNA polymerase [Muribaculaceae bacterium]
MNKKVQNVLSLTSDEALNFFMKSEQYHGFELPEYFVFDNVLQYVKDIVGDIAYEDCVMPHTLPDDLADVNFDILLNKDGRYAVRPIVLANPFLYYFLVREVCNEEGWAVVKSLFEKFKVPGITSCALPVVPEKVEPFHKSTTILNWWSSMEQRSIELSLEFRYMFVTDITNCYGSVNPQVFDWAFDLKNTQYESPCDHNIANNIQKYLRAFQQGRNIGIPQGSAIFDFVGEIILGYSDLLLHEAIQRAGITAKYEIIRYRDDYRIFCNEKDQLEQISYILQQVLESLNFRMNSPKTKISESIVTDSIKSDKLFYIYNTPIFNKKGTDFDSFEKHLLYILMFARQYPNSGQVKTMLSDVDKRIEEWLQPQEREIRSFTLEREGFVSTKETYVRKLTGGSVRAMVAVAVQIALENVTMCNYALRVISRMINSVADAHEKQKVIELVYNKLANTPNSTYNQLWLQNMTYTQDKENNRCDRYNIRLCQVVMGEHTMPLWNNSWLKEDIIKQFPYDSIVDKETLKKVTPVITFRERRAYDEKFYV